jgi:SAM-dependent methyltransferase
MHKIVLSGPVKNSTYVKAEIIRNENGYLASLFTANKVFHHNIKAEAVDSFVDGLFGSSFCLYNAWDGEYHYSKRITKKGKVLTSKKADKTPQKEDRQKNHIIKEGMNIPALLDLGVNREKLVQINRFLELISDEIKHLKPGDRINVIDFGCGKSYLTFMMYFYFNEILGLRVNMCGLDNHADVVAKCNVAASKYGYTELTFLQGDIGRQDNPPVKTWGQEGTFNMVVSLHACDTATDYTLFNAVKWDADLICAVPCCQHELRDQMLSGDLPLFSRYGIVKERVASLATDVIRAALLERFGYKVQIIELTDRENTAKNLMIRARKKKNNTPGKHEKTVTDEVSQMIKAFGFYPMLWRLLVKHGKINEHV